MLIGFGSLLFYIRIRIGWGGGGGGGGILKSQVKFLQKITIIKSFITVKKHPIFYVNLLFTSVLGDEFYLPGSSLEFFFFQGIENK